MMVLTVHAVAVAARRVYEAVGGGRGELAVDGVAQLRGIDLQLGLRERGIDHKGTKNLKLPKA